MRFLVDEEVKPLAGVLLYRLADHAFDYEANDPEALKDRIGTAGVASVSIGTLQIEVAITGGLALYVWGYHPRARWLSGDLPEIARQPGGLRIAPDGGWIRGAGVRAPGADLWRTVHDPATGWLLVGTERAHTADRYVEFASCTVAALVGHELVGLRLMPRFDTGIGSA